MSGNVCVPTAGLDHLLAGVEGQEKEDDKDDTEDREDDYPHHEVHCRERPLFIIWDLGDTLRLIKQVSHCPPNRDLMYLQNENRPLDRTCQN